MGEPTAPQPEQHAFRLHLPGLLKVLAEHLYSNKQVAVRELIQNAHDSCIRRATGDYAPEEYRPRIRITLDAVKRLLTVEDNGSGLTEAEINDYLSTIGRSYTRELKENLALFSPDEAAQLIGQFGFGFLSAFLLASEVTVTSRSMEPGEGAVRWKSKGNEHYEITSARRSTVGTTVQLKVKPEAAFILDENLLGTAIRRYADFLPIPIFLNDGVEPINLMSTPWELAQGADDPGQVIYEYIESRFPNPLGPPLAVLPLVNHRIDLGHDALELPLEGLLFIPAGSAVSVFEHGDLAVYNRRMFIRDEEKALLPNWARFVRGVIDCPYLQTTASREDLHQDETFEWVRTAIERQLGNGLRVLAEEEPEVWREIVAAHASLMTSWALSNENFWNQIADLISFPTTRGRLTLPEYLKLTDGEIFYVTRELGSLQDQLVAEAQGVPVIDASWTFFEPFLVKYASTRPGLRAVQVNGEGEELLRPARESGFEALLDFYARRGIRARLSTFKPREVPALMLYPRDAEFITDTRNALSNEELPSPLGDLIGDYVENMAPSPEELEGTLHLNASCPLVRRLAESARVATSPAVDATLELIFQVARLFSGKTLTVRDAAKAFEGTGHALEKLLDGQRP